MSDPLGYETMSDGIEDLTRYYAWVYEAFSPFLGSRILEIGPGYGVLAEKLIKGGKTYFAVDRDARVIEALRRKRPEMGDRARVADLDDPSFQTPEAWRTVDTLLSMNVLEHIEQDGLHLQMLRSRCPSARLLLFVPAFPMLYGTFDEQAGHYRRYTKAGLESLLDRSGYAVKATGYFNALGMLPWWLANVVLRLPVKGGTTSRLALLYDRVGVPVARVIDPLFNRWVGQSLIVSAAAKP